MTDEQKHAIRSHWDIFCNNLRTDDLVAVLFSEGVLSLHQKEGIDHLLTTHEKAEFIMSSVVMRATQRDLRAFKTALIRTNQSSLASLLPDSPPQPNIPLNIEEPVDMETGIIVTFCINQFLLKFCKIFGV